MKSGFVELVVKKVIGGRTVALEQKAPRYRAIDSFKKYIEETLPTMEESIEINLLKKSLPKIKDKQIRRELISAYLRRLFRLRTYEKEDIKNYKEIRPAIIEPIANIVDPTILKKIEEHTEYDCGFYSLFSKEDMNKVFKHGCFGRYSEEEYASTEKFGIQIREESISIAAVMKLVMKRLEKNKKESFNWETFRNLSEEEIESKINSTEEFPILFLELSQQVYQYAQKYRGHAEYERVWGSSISTDVIVNSILQNKKNLESAIQTAQQVVDAVMQQEPLPSPNDFSYRFKVLPGSPEENPIKTEEELPFNSRFYCRTPSFNSFFLGGEGGTGKSMILAYLSMFAFKQGWITINVPNAYNWTHDRRTKYVRAYNGLYLINEHAVQWLDQFLTANKELLESREINEEIYGKCDITGSHTEEAEPVPNIYIPERRVYFNDIGDQFTNRLQEEEEELREQAKKRLTKILQKPKNIYEIGIAGIKNPEYATCAMGEILRQVYNIKDIPILECVDSFSYLYRASAYPSFRYYNDRDLWGRIPPYHIAHCRMFVNLDGHKLANGIKVVASSNYPMYMHKFTIKQMMYPEIYEHKVRNLTMSEFKNAGQFNILNNWWQADEIQRVNTNYAFTLVQGNWGDFQKLMNLGHYY